MATTKQSLFPEGQVALAAFAGALAHPARIAIIGLLQAREEACCGEIVKALPLAQATVSQHLQVLNRVGLLHHRQCGPKICYSINCEALRSFCHSFQCTLGTAEEAAASAPHL
jgi:ArsR family transcriptional regulator